MAKSPRKQIVLAQNFLRSSSLVRALVRRSSIEPADIVYEIGPGHGILTAELARIAHKVVAVEKDRALVQQLRERFRSVHNVEIVAYDFLQYRISDRRYKIFASIPYNATADIVRKILSVPPVPSEAYLVMQKEAALKFAGMPRETLFSVLAKPVFTLRIVRELRRRDFRPVPNVDSVLLHIEKRRLPLIGQEDFSLYRHFVHYGFSCWKKNLKVAFKRVFTYQQWKYLSKDLHFPLDATPSQLTFEQWLGLFDCFKHRVPGCKQEYIKG